MPDLRTIEYWTQEEPHNQNYSQSKVMAQHNKAGLHERRFALMMNDNFRLTSDLDACVFPLYARPSFLLFYPRSGILAGLRLMANGCHHVAFFRHVYNTQMMQLEAVGYAYRMWRREWRGRGKEYVSVLTARSTPFLPVNLISVDPHLRY